MFKNILAATDLVSVSDRVVMAAVKIAQNTRQTSHVLMCWNLPHVDTRALVKHF